MSAAGDQLPDREVEARRAAALVTGLIDKLEQRAGESDLTEPLVFESMALVVIATSVDEDGDPVEIPFTRFETRRPHVQRGILQIALDHLRGIGR